MDRDNKNIRVGVYGVLIRDHKILMVRTQSGSRLVYNFPGGGVDFDEGLNDALIRECSEELGVTVTVKDQIFSSQKLYTHTDFPGTCSFNLYYAIACTTPIDIEEQGAAWFDLDHLPLAEMLEADLEFVEFLRKKETR